MEVWKRLYIVEVKRVVLNMLRCVKYHKIFLPCGSVERFLHHGSVERFLHRGSMDKFLHYENVKGFLFVI